MGQDVERRAFSRDDRQRYRQKVRRCLDVLGRMLDESAFDVDKPMVGLEIELNLVDPSGDPALRNAEVLQAVASPEFQTELGQFNLEINVEPRALEGGGLTSAEVDVRASLNRAETIANSLGAHLVSIGILPTLMPQHTGRQALSANPRYGLMNDAIFEARGEDLRLHIEGPQVLDVYADTILPEAACTSTQFHLQVSPSNFARYWNAAQCLAAVQIGLGANSPFFFGKQLWRETRIALFEQATDTRPEELKAQGVRPRVWFGEGWITSIFDLFEENVRYFPALLPILDPEDPAQVLEAGGTPSLAELRLHNGTIWRWNRPVYDVVGDVPHVRVENRVLPAGPSVADTIANGAFFYGAMQALATAQRPIWSRMSFHAAEENFHEAARAGIDARIFWPGVGEVPITELVLRHLLPLAAAGCAAWGVSPEEVDRYLGCIEQRCLRYRNGASWQVEVVEHLDRRYPGQRLVNLRRMQQLYTERMHANLPVHEWSLE